jgi:radical SAM protein with 4Fe4S-binding SPASM domain
MRIGPDYIQFYPTLRCNQSCDFCFNRALPFVPDISLEACRIMFNTLKAVGVRTIDIIGGEPTLHPGIIDIVLAASQRGLDVNISSNGTNPDVLEELLLSDSRVSIGISINDRNALEHLSGFVQKNAVIVKSVYRSSMDEAFIRDILALRPGKFYLIYRDALERTDLHESIPFHEFASVVGERFGSLNVGTVFCSGFIPDSAHYPELAQVRCPAGTTKLGILPDGSFYPCNLFFGNREFLLGNILTGPFESIWNHRALAWFRRAAENSCPEKTCSLHTRCHGGCPAHSFAHIGSVSSPEPRCVQG